MGRNDKFDCPKRTIDIVLKTSQKLTIGVIEAKATLEE